MKKYKEMFQPIGVFEIKSRLRVSDPCYDPNVWCSGTLFAKKGNWIAAAMKFDNRRTNGWGDRIAILAAKHESCPIPIDATTINNTAANLKAGDWYETGFEVGVDSGQAGFYDNDAFIARDGGRNRDWYNEVCDMTILNNMGVLEDCVVVSSGYGDGGYPCYYHADKKGQADYVYVIFIDPDD